METPSKELLQRVKSGEEGAFEELYRLCYQHIYSMAFFLLKNHHDAEDAVQNTFLRVYTGIRSLRDEDKFVSWLDKIAYHEFIRQMQFSKEEVALDAETEIRYLEALEEDFSLPAPYTENRDLARRLWKLLLDLPAEQRQVLVLYYYHRLSVKEIAEMIGVSVGTVTSRLHYARVKIKKYVEQQEKKTGDKFYGVPLLPFGKALERLFNQNTEKKKEKVLWAGFQKELQSLGYSGSTVLFVGNKRLLAAKIAAGVIAAAILMSGVSAAFAGELPESGRGWGHLSGAGQNDPKGKNPSEPASNGDDLMNPFYEPADAAPRENITTDNVDTAVQYNAADNETQNRPVLPTESVVQNPLIAPTQALTRPTEQSAVDPTAPAPTQNSGVYQAYRTLLLKNEQAIKAYIWQYSDASYPVALADIYGDSTPEMLYFSASGNTAQLNIYTYDGAKTVSLLNGSALSSNADIDDTYFLFQKSGDKRLYLYSADDSDYGTSRCLRLDESGGGLSVTELCSSKAYPSKFVVNGKEVSTSAYAAFESSLFSDISGILIRNDARGMCSQEAYDALERHASKATSFNDMLDYLEEQ